MSDSYFAYLLRLWRVGQGQDAVWRASLEGAYNTEVRVFAGLEPLLAYLRAQIREESGSETAAGGVGAPPRASDGPRPPDQDLGHGKG